MKSVLKGKLRFLGSVGNPVLNRIPHFMILVDTDILCLCRWFYVLWVWCFWWALVCVCFYDLSLLLEIEFCCAVLVSVFAGQGSPSAGHS